MKRIKQETAPRVDVALDVPHSGRKRVEERAERRLVADEQYFGLDARVLRAGLDRVWRELPHHAPIDVATLGEGLRLGVDEAGRLADALLKGGLLVPEAGGRYRPTALFREYSRAVVVAPLSRDRAKVLLEQARELTAEINGDWVANPLRVKVVAVSGSYMSRRRHLPDLCLWVVLRRRAKVRNRPWKRALGRSDALREILRAFGALSSFIVVRVVTDPQDVPRPFAIVWQADDDVVAAHLHTWDRFRDWGASISRRLTEK